MADDSLSACVAEIKAHPGKFYVYILSRPEGTPFYVGYGRAGLSRERIAGHEDEARRKAPRARENKHKLNVIRSIWRDGGTVGRRIDSWHDDAAAAKAREVDLIATVGRADLGLGPLTNLTAGGDGSVDLTDDGKHRMREGQRRGGANRRQWAASNPEAQQEIGRRAGRLRAEWMRSNPDDAKALQSKAGKIGVRRMQERIAADPVVRDRARVAWAEAGARFALEHPEAAKAAGKALYSHLRDWQANNVEKMREARRRGGQERARRAAEARLLARTEGGAK